MRNQLKLIEKVSFIAEYVGGKKYKVKG